MKGNVIEKRFFMGENMKNRHFSPVLLKYLRNFLLVQTIPLIFLFYLLYDHNIVGIKNNIDDQYQDALSNMSTKLDYMIADILKNSVELKNFHEIELFLHTTEAVKNIQAMSIINRYQDLLQPVPKIALYNRERKEIITDQEILTYQQFEEMTIGSLESSMIQFYSKINATQNYQIFSNSNTSSSKKLYVTCSIASEKENQTKDGYQ